MRLEKRALIGLTLAASSTVLAGCATTASSSQMQNLKTEASQLPMGYASSALESGACVELSRHELQGKVGVTIGHDLSLLANEIDDVVEFNGGNSYAVNSWQWITVDAWGSTAPLVDITVLNCGEPPSSVEAEHAVIDPSDATPDDYSIIEICTDISKIARFIMTARQNDKPMSQTLPHAIAQTNDWARQYEFPENDEIGTEMVMKAYEHPTWDSDGLRKDEISDFENGAFKGCYEALTTDFDE